MGADEEGILARRKALRTELVDPKIAEHHGRIVKSANQPLTPTLSPQAGEGVIGAFDAPSQENPLPARGERCTRALARGG